MNRHELSTESGSVTILMIVFVSIAMLIVIGTLSVMEWNSSLTKFRNQTQASANAGAYTYGKSYLKHMRVCVVEDISEQLETPGDEAFELCRVEGLAECVESDFQTCEVDLFKCWEEGASPMDTCSQDETVKNKAHADAVNAANRLLRYEELDAKNLAVDGQEFSSESEFEQRTLLPQLGKSGKIRSFARSLIHVKVEP